MALSCSPESTRSLWPALRVSLVSVTMCEWPAVLQSRNTGPLRAASGHLFLHTYPMPGPRLHTSSKQKNASYHDHYKENFLDPSLHHGIISLLIPASSVGRSCECCPHPQYFGFSPFISQGLVCSVHSL